MTQHFNSNNFLRSFISEPHTNNLGVSFLKVFIHFVYAFLHTDKGKSAILSEWRSEGIVSKVKQERNDSTISLNPCSHTSTVLCLRLLRIISNVLLYYCSTEGCLDYYMYSCIVYCTQ